MLANEKMKNWKVNIRQWHPGISNVFSILKAGQSQSHCFLLQFTCPKSFSNWQSSDKVHMLFHTFCCLYKAILVDSTQIQGNRSLRPPLELFKKHKENPCVSFIQQFGVNVVFGQDFPENHLILQVSPKSRYTTRIPAGGLTWSGDLNWSRICSQHLSELLEDLKKFTGYVKIETTQCLSNSSRARNHKLNLFNYPGPLHHSPLFLMALVLC